MQLGLKVLRGSKLVEGSSILDPCNLISCVMYAQMQHDTPTHHHDDAWPGQRQQHASITVSDAAIYVLQASKPWIATTWLQNMPVGQDNAMALASVCEDTNPACR